MSEVLERLVRASCSGSSRMLIQPLIQHGAGIKIFPNSISGPRTSDLGLRTSDVGLRTTDTPLPDPQTTAMIERMPAPRGTKAWAQGLAIVRILSEAAQPLSATAVAERLGVSVSTASRALGALAAAGYVIKPDYHHFAPSIGVVTLAANAREHFGIAAAGRGSITASRRAPPVGRGRWVPCMTRTPSICFGSGPSTKRSNSRWAGSRSIYQ